MAITFFDAQLYLARVLMDVWESTATGGSTTTVIDTKLAYPDGYFSDQPRGTLFLDLTVKATKIITNHASSTITFTPAQGAAVQPNDIYMACPGIYPKHILEQSIKMALVKIGKVPASKDITMVVDQAEWDNTDDAIFDEEIIGVEFAGNAAAPYNWMPHYQWYQVQLTAGKTLVFHEGALPANTNKMRVFYIQDHPAMSTLTTEVSTFINTDRLIWTAAVHALRWRIQRVKQIGDTSAEVGQLMTEAKENLLSQAQEQLVEAQENVARLANLYPVVRQRTPHQARW